LPVSLKDLTVTKGIRTTRGSLLTADWVPEDDAPVTERVYAAGGVLLGKTNTPESGWKGESTNRVVGSSQNPWQIGRTPGGSSGGAGAAVAAGLGQLAQGTDGAGSIRIPASFCGIFGLKPSYGLVPYWPGSAVQSIAHVGPMTRTVRDGALLLDALAGPDPRDRGAIPPAGNYLAACEGGVAGLRLGWAADLGFGRAEPAVEAAVEEAARVFQELGATVEPVAPGWSDPFPIIDALWSSGMAASRPDFEQVRTLLDPGLARVIEHGLELRGVDVARAEVLRTQFYEDVRRFTAPFDLLLTPTVPVTAFAAGRDDPGEINGQARSYLGWTYFTYPFNLTGQPAATVPAGFVDGLPVGLQLVGRFRDDATVLRAAAAFESVRPWAAERPSLG
ncbi:MAG TPA: amidase family protein, partial [Nitrolancea sp.]|nr:amidase family protein [Nitrolancea sp.]